MTPELIVTVPAVPPKIASAFAIQVEPFQAFAAPQFALPPFPPGPQVNVVAPAEIGHASKPPISKGPLIKKDRFLGAITF